LPLYVYGFGLLLNRCPGCKNFRTFFAVFPRNLHGFGLLSNRCPGCKNFHLIADNKGWFRDDRITIEDIARENNVPFQKFMGGESGALEVSPEDLQLLAKVQNSQSTKGQPSST